MDAGHLKDSERVQFPPGLANAYYFAVFNALSFQIVLSSPMVLYAKTLGASATVLGILSALMPLLVIFQIPAAQYIPRVGFRRFVFTGWGLRVAFIFGMAMVPLLGVFLDAGSQLALLLMLLFGFNLSRGISSCAWLPWISALVPEALRGRYLARDAACVNLASFVSFILAAVWLGPAPKQWQFAVLFAFSAVMGMASLSFLKRMPDTPVPEEDRGAKSPVPWRAMLKHPPFQRVLLTTMTWFVAYGGLQAFPVAFLKSEIGMSESRILLITSLSFLGGLSSLWFLGSRLDSIGSRPVIIFCLSVWLLVLGGWVGLSGRVLSPSMATLLVLHFFMGLLAALINMANTRLAMAVIPVMGRTHFFALYSVLANLAFGLSPVGWGILIDALGTVQTQWLGLSWNRYTCFFASVACVLGVALIFAKRLEEPKAASMEALLREILIQSPQRFWFRLWPRG